MSPVRLRSPAFRSLVKSNAHETILNHALHRQDDGWPFVVQIRLQSSASECGRAWFPHTSVNPHRGDCQVIRKWARGVGTDPI